MARGLPRPRFEVADIVRAHGADLRLRRVVTHREAKVLRHLGQCRTPSLGGHRDVCDDCGHESISYNSCRDRHCPKCQGTERAKWLERRLQHVLPIPYFHAVFTVPPALRALVFANRRQLYAALFDASAQTLQQLARDEQRLGAELGINGCRNQADRWQGATDQWLELLADRECGWPSHPVGSASRQQGPRSAPRATCAIGQVMKNAV